MRVMLAAGLGFILFNVLTLNVCLGTNVHAEAGGLSGFHLAATQSEKWLDTVLKGPERLGSMRAGTNGLQKRKVVFSQALLDAWYQQEKAAIAENCNGQESEGELCGLDYDPLLCAQEDNDGRYLYRTDRTINGEIYISMRWDQEAQPVASYRLVAHGNQWVIDGIMCRDFGRFNMRSRPSRHMRMPRMS